MGRIVDLLGEVAAAAEEGAEGLEIPLDARERLLECWRDEDLDDAVSLVRDSLSQGELVEAADSLSARLVEVLGAFGAEAAFGQVREDRAHLSLDVIGQLTRRVARLEEILDVLRDGPPPDGRGFEELRLRLADVGIEAEMGSEPGGEPEGGV